MNFGIALAAGLKDAINPCVLMTCAALILLGTWLFNQKHRAIYCVLFIIGVVIWTVVLNVTPLGVYVYSPKALKFSKYTYSVFGILALTLGYFWGKDWLILRSQSTGKLLQERFKAPQRIHPLLIWFILGMCAVIFSALATAWPMDYYMGIMAMNLMMPGQFQISGWIFIVYVIVALWPLYLTFYVLTTAKMPRSLVTIICSAIYTTAGFGILYIFK